MKIVAFMQTPSHVLDKTAVDRYKTDQEFHREQLAMSMSGNRLLMAFGKKMFHEIWWDNVQPTPPDAGSPPKPDFKHIDRVLAEQKADIVLTFGNIAREALVRTAGGIGAKMFHCHHPNARYYSQEALDTFAQEVRDWAFQNRADLVVEGELPDVDY